MGRWDDSEADPRVRWALKILDDEGEVHFSLARVLGVYGIGAAVFASGPIIQNIVARRPLYAGIHRTFPFTLAGLGFTHGVRMWTLKQDQRETAVMKHYIMTNPEKFPEPEEMKYGHKSALLPWDPHRN